MVTRRTLMQMSAATLVAWEGLCERQARADELRVGAPAPMATLVTLDGQRVSTADLLGKVVILTFWATWCAPCRDELPLLSRYAAAHARAGLQVLGFSLDAQEAVPEVRHIAQSLSFPVGLLADSKASGYGHIWRLPLSFTIGRVGLLVADGWQERRPAWTPQRLEQLVTPLLKAPA